MSNPLQQLRETLVEALETRCPETAPSTDWYWLVDGYREALRNALTLVDAVVTEEACRTAYLEALDKMNERGRKVERLPYLFFRAQWLAAQPKDPS